MSVIDTLIFDRTQSDIINDTDKAYIDYNDLNRIEEAVKYLSDLLNDYNYMNNVEERDKWIISEFRNEENCNRIKRNYEILKSVYAYKFDVPEFKWGSIEEANAIEKILFDLDFIITNMENYFIHCGVANCGQSRLWQQRFRRGSLWSKMIYAIGKYNQAWNTLTIESNEIGTGDTHETISKTLNLWNSKLNYIDSVTGVIYDGNT